MKQSKYQESQMIFAIKQAETGTSISEVFRKMGTSEATFYNWKKKYGVVWVFPNGVGPRTLKRGTHSSKSFWPSLAFTNSFCRTF